MWDILLRAVIGAAVGAATVYAASKIIDALWPRFVDLWKSFVADVKEILGYITEATEVFLANIAEFIQEQWEDVKSLIREAFGYIEECIVFLFQEDDEVYLGFMNPSTEETSIGSIGQAPSDAPLPNKQVIAGKLKLS